MTPSVTFDQSRPPSGFEGGGSAAGRKKRRYGPSRSRESSPGRSPVSSWQRPGKERKSSRVAAESRSSSRRRIRFALRDAVCGQELADFRDAEVLAALLFHGQELGRALRAASQLAKRTDGPNVGLADQDVLLGNQTAIAPIVAEMLQINDNRVSSQAHLSVALLG